MPTPSLPVSLTNGTTADADDVMENFDYIAGAGGLLDAQLDSDNLASAGVAKANLATDALHAFLQLATAADKKVAFGQATAHWASTSQFSSTLDVTHGLGVTPTFYTAMCLQDSVALIAFGVSAPSSTQFHIQMANPFGAINSGTDYTVCWLAIG